MLLGPLSQDLRKTNCGLTWYVSYNLLESQQFVTSTENEWILDAESMNCSRDPYVEIYEVVEQMEGCI